jgi:pyruvate carboxylase
MSDARLNEHAKRLGLPIHFSQHDEISTYMGNVVQLCLAALDRLEVAKKALSGSTAPAEYYSERSHRRKILNVIREITGGRDRD